MLRSVLGVAAGVIVGALIIFVVEAIGHGLFPPPAGVNVKDPRALAEIMDQIPFGAKLAVLLAWFLGILGGGVVGARIGQRWAPVAWIVAATLFAMAVITMIQIPHPLWMAAGSVIATVAGALGAIRFAGATYARPVQGQEFGQTGHG